MVWLQSGILVPAERRHLPDRARQQAAEGRQGQRGQLRHGPNGNACRDPAVLPGLPGLRRAGDDLRRSVGTVVGKAGGNKLDNVNPSLSPDGSQVAFERDAFNNPGKTYGIWTANTNGSHLRRVARVGEQPLWSPKGATIAYVRSEGKSVPLRLVSAGGGKSRALVPNVMTVFGWSPDGKSIAFETGKGRLAVVNVATRKVRSLRQLRNAQTAVWSPDSSELLANTVSKTCWSTWRVPANGSAPTRISSCH